MSLDEFLIATQLGSVVAADALVPIARGVIVERRNAEIQYAVVLLRIGKYSLVGWRFLEELC